MRGLLLGLGLLVVACRDDPPRATVSTGDASPDPEDGGGAGRDSGPPSIRPDGGPTLPPADEVIELAFGGSPVAYQLSAEASLGVLDVHLSVDTSASIDLEIDTLQRDLMRDVLPSLREVVPLLSVGVSRFEDFPLLPYGNQARSGQRADRPFELLTPITSNETKIAAAVTRLDRPLGIGGDIPESGAEALFQIATGLGYSLGNEDFIEPFEGAPEHGGGDIGGVGFRQGALHVVLHITDAPTHQPIEYEDFFPGTHTLEEAATALQAIDARAISIVSGACARRSVPCNEGPTVRARRELEGLALATGAFTDVDDDGECPHGIDGAAHEPREDVCPLVFDVSDEGEGLAETFTTAITTLVDGIRFARVTAVASDDPLGFVRRVKPIAAGDDAPEIEDLLPNGAPDGEPDTFVNARGAAPLVFEVLLQNSRLSPREEPQSFRVVLQVLGDGLIVEERTLRVVVPAGALPGADEDAGG